MQNVDAPENRHHVLYVFSIKFGEETTWRSVLMTSKTEKHTNRPDRQLRLLRMDDGHRSEHHQGENKCDVEKPECDLSESHFRFVEDVVDPQIEHQQPV